MKIYLKDVVNFFKAYEDLSQQQMNIKLAWSLHKVKDTLTSDLEFYKENAKEILNKYAKKDKQGNIKYTEDGNSVMLEDATAFQQGLNELQMMEREITPEQISIDLLPNEITPSLLEALSKVFILK